MLAILDLLTFSCISYNWKVGSNLIMSGIETE